MKLLPRVISVFFLTMSSQPTATLDCFECEWHTHKQRIAQVGTCNCRNARGDIMSPENGCDDIKENQDDFFYFPGHIDGRRKGEGYDFCVEALYRKPKEQFKGKVHRLVRGPDVIFKKLGLHDAYNYSVRACRKNQKIAGLHWALVCTCLHDFCNNHVFKEFGVAEIGSCFSVPRVLLVVLAGLSIFLHHIRVFVLLRPS